MPNTELKAENIPQRLCSEIQLFDLCDLDVCTHKNGRFCKDLALLVRFEKIAEKEMRITESSLSDDDDDFEPDGCYGEEGDDPELDYSDAVEDDPWDDKE